MTTQLLEEKKSKENFKSWCKDRGYKLIKEYSSHENKVEKTTADFTILIDGKDKKVSLKTEGGTFTEGNLGTGISALSRWNNKEEDKEILRKASEKYREVKKIFPKSVRWEEVNDQDEVRFSLLSPFINAWFEILSKEDNFYSFIEYLLERKSDYVWVNGNLIPQKETKTSFSIKKYKSKSIILGETYELRFKSSGGRIHSGVKINIQPCR